MEQAAPSPSTSPSPIRKKKKTLNACQRCRTRKIKCSGQDPCLHCISRSVKCVFEDRPKKLVVSEEYLQRLESLASGFEPYAAETSARIQSSPLISTASMPLQGGIFTERDPGMPISPPFSRSTERPQHPHVTSDSFRNVPQPAHEDVPNELRSDLRIEREFLPHSQNNSESQYAIGDGYRRLGHSSSWSFSRRIRNMINDATGGLELHDAISIRDGAYGIPWRKQGVDLEGLDLPTEDYAEYLASTVSFTMSPLYHLYDKEAFLKNLRRFYSEKNAGQEISTDLWCIQMLVVFAFGKSILAREAGPSGLTGAAYFAKAVEALPDSHRLYQEPILSIEILCMFALLMQAMDMRFAAYDYIGQATRIALIYGLNRRFDAQRMSHSEFEHRSKLWWSVFVIDRRLSSLIGVPPAVHDEDIALPMPRIDSTRPRDVTLAFHVELSSQLGQILNVVYGLGPQRQLGAKFVEAIQSILYRLADTSVMLNNSMKIEVQRPVDTISRTAASLHLLHHQCTILAIRPVLFFLMEKKLATNNNLALSEAVIGLLRVCVESALQVLKIIEALRAHKLIDLLLPFDLEAMFAAAFVLVLVDIIAPAASGQWDLKKTFTLMDGMELRGIITAGPYKKDLMELDNLRQRLKVQPRRESTFPEEQLNQPAEILRSMSAANPGPETIEEQAQLAPQAEQDLIWSWIATENSDLGVLHPDTIQSAIDSLNFDFLNDSSTIELAGSEWMWGDFVPGASN